MLAPGSVPRTLPGFDVDGKIVMTSDEFLSIAELPKRAAIIGGGVIGCEFASLLADLGTKVTILEALPKILPGLDKDVTKVIEKSFKRRGIDIRTDVKVEGHSPTGSSTTVQAGGEGLDVDVVVVSIGRKPNTDDLGLDGTAVKVDERGFIEVDDVCRTGEPGVWAVGDAIATPALAHIGFIEGILAIRGFLGEDPPGVDYEKVPWAVYSPARGRLRGALGGRGQGRGLRRRHPEEPLQPQRAGDDREPARRHGEGDRREGRRTGGPGASSVSTWWARGSPNSSARATSPSTGRPRSMTWRPSSSPTRR